MRRLCVFFAAPFRVLFSKFDLAKALLLRDIKARYQGSTLGFMWMVFLPLLMLLVYTFFFGFVMKTKWGASGNTHDFIMLLFCGLIVFGFFSETTIRAPTLIVGNPSYVKKIIFPLDLLAWVNVLSGLVLMGASFLVWFVFYFVFYGAPSLYTLLAPIVLLPLIFVALGISWFLSSLTVYMRDIGQVVGVLTTGLMFITPVFFPTSSLSEKIRSIVMLNPISIVIEQMRDVLFYAHGFNVGSWLFALCVSVVIMYSGYYWFKLTRKGFADVI